MTNVLSATDLRPYQQDAIDFLYENEGSLALLPMGAGKTVIAATTMRDLLRDSVVNRWLVIAPKRVCQMVWPQEFQKWEHLKHIEAAVALGTAEQRKAAVESSAPIVIINYDNLVWLIESGGIADFDGIIFDEISRMKNPRSKRFKALKKHLDQFKVRIGLTGTPTSNGIGDIFGQVFCVDQGKRLGRSASQFKSTYYNKTGPMQWQWEPKPDALVSIMDAVSDICYQIPDSVYVSQLPPVVTNIIKVQLPDDVREVYDTLEREFVATVGDSDVMVANAGVLVNKLQQIANGFLYDEQRTNDLHDAKIEAYKEILEEQQGAPTLVAYKYTADLTSLCFAHMGPHLGSGVTDKKAEHAIGRWNSGTLPVLYVHPASAGHGLNLQSGGNTVVWYGLTWSLEEHDQTIARLCRHGQEAKQVWCHYIVAENTVDEDIMAALEAKKDVQTAVIEGIRKRRAAWPNTLTS